MALLGDGKISAVGGGTWHRRLSRGLAAINYLFINELSRITHRMRESVAPASRPAVVWVSRPGVPGKPAFGLLGW
jgi:hypothetical protein